MSCPLLPPFCIAGGLVKYRSWFAAEVSFLLAQNPSPDSRSSMPNVAASFSLSPGKYLKHCIFVFKLLSALRSSAKVCAGNRSDRGTEAVDCLATHRRRRHAPWLITACADVINVRRPRLLFGKPNRNTDEDVGVPQGSCLVSSGSHESLWMERRYSS